MKPQQQAVVYKVRTEEVVYRGPVHDVGSRQYNMYLSYLDAERWIESFLQSEGGTAEFEYDAEEPEDDEL